jgi:mono/diheme cytochrome c family protein
VAVVDTPRHTPARLRRALLAASVVLAGGSVAVACSARGSTAAPAQQNGATSSLSGSDVYLISCARCHGDNREGKTDAPALGSVRIASLGEQPLRFTIQFGKGRMPAFGALSPEKVDALIAFLRGT